MSRIIDQGLEEQSVLLIRMGELAHETITTAIRNYFENKNVQPHVKEISDVIIAMAGKVEDQTFELIARFQPVASDLRTIKSHMKISNDFSRYSRYALDISNITHQLHGLAPCEAWIQNDLAEMGNKVLFMVKTSIDALRKHDVNLAKTISPIEREIDQMYEDVINKIISQEKTNNKCVASSILLTRYFERIADHAVYACESIVYIVTGEKISLE
ncbi:phosphate signaling complex protein PhoU [Candidatus Bathycorpusculum sp.]|jgi:phosphate transport system protein|uniref:phosphate signaling complex protein PhoU n=1 Tax=Candidatus Bathycorpusculum sp. TaxID=2994959 RepID=UPI00283209F4|nr:phosphate signaling complex protein PhoU [Candidatus Termitimicrobium sp.]MCL2685759.1 phosphate signaling complex protein PhoU [Candidatus Termitimicrobium sp.]